MNNDLQEQFVRDMLTESYEGLDRYDQAILDLEQGNANSDTLHDIFRVVHTFKGTAGCLGFSHIEKLSHTGENLLDLLREHTIDSTPAITDALLKLSDALRAMLNSIETNGTDDDGRDYSELSATLTALRTSPEGNSSPESASSSPAVASSSIDETSDAPPPEDTSASDAAETVDSTRAPAAEASAASDNPAWGLFEDNPADAAPAASEEGNSMETASPTGWGLFEEPAEPHAAAPTEPTETPAEPEPKSTSPAQDPAKPALNRAVTANASVRVDVGLLDRLMNMVGELVLSRNQLLQISQHKEITSEDVTTVSQRLNQVTSELQESVMKTRMQPIGTVWNKFSRIVRDLANGLGKTVRFETVGSDTELDRTIIEAIKDPLTHIIRNAIDHGVEMPADREAAGKTAEAHVLMRAFHEGGQVNIEIIDDGAGINGEKIRRKAVEKGIISEEDSVQLTEREMVNLIFAPGFSTAEKVTNVSGRGVGMDVVKTNIEKIGGSVDLQSVAGQGTTLKIKIPLTLAIVPALIVRNGGQRFAIPQVSLVELVRLEGEAAENALETVFDTPVFRLRGNLLPLVFMHKVLRRPAPPATEPQILNIVVLRSDQRQFGLVVDEVLDSEEIVVKPLGKQLKNLLMFAGATIMGDGQIALIVDALGLAQHTGVLDENAREGLHAGDLGTEASVGGDDHNRLLLFSLPGRDRLALPLEQAARLEEFPVSSIESAGRGEAVQYRNGIMPLVRLAQHLPARSGATASPSQARDSEQVIVYQNGNQLVGLVVGEIRDIIENPIAPGEESNAGGIEGSAIIQGKITDLIDVPAVLSAAGISLQPAA